MFIVLDVTDFEDVSEVPKYVEKLHNYLSSEVPFVIMANKTDMDPE